MTSVKIAVQGQRIALLNSVDLVAGTVGQKCILYFDAEWQQMKKSIAYKVGNTVVSSEALPENEAVIPPIALANQDLPLEIGITGRSADNSVTIPTLWCLVGMIRGSAAAYYVDTDTKIVYDGGVIV